SGMLGRLMDCPYCLSLWIAAPAALLLANRLPDGCAAWLAVSGGSSLLEKFSHSIGEPNSTNLPLKGAHDDVMLWTETPNNPPISPPDLSKRQAPAVSAPTLLRHTRAGVLALRGPRSGRSYLFSDR